MTMQSSSQECNALVQTGTETLGNPPHSLPTSFLICNMETGDFPTWLLWGLNEMLRVNF